MTFFEIIIDTRMSVRYNSITNKRSEDKDMQRVIEPNNDFFATLKDSYKIARSRPNFNVLPQMPTKQIQHYVTQAAREDKQVIIQMNPSPNNRQMTEITGTISLSHRSSHVILNPLNEQMVHLIQPQHIRHLRLV